VDGDVVVASVHLDQPVAHRRAEQPADPLPPVARGRQVVHPPAVVLQRHRHRGLRQRRPHERLGGMRPFRGGGPQERPPRRHVGEELVHLHGRAERASVGHDLPHAAAVDLDRRPGARGGPRADHEPRHLADRRERLPAEAERLDVLEILGRPQLTRGVRRHRQRQVLRFDPAAVVYHPHQRDAALLEDDVDPSRCGVERVFQQLLHDARGPFDDLARRDAVDHRHRQLFDSSHAPLHLTVRSPLQAAAGLPVGRQESWNSLILR
jgi:hypothetical protein